MLCSRSAPLIRPHKTVIKSLVRPKNSFSKLSRKLQYRHNGRSKSFSFLKNLTQVPHRIEISFDRMTEGMETSVKNLCILHFNDVYNIEPSSVEPFGGAARMKTLLNHLEPHNPLVLFSGDCMNPSMISSVEKGNQMIPVLNDLQVGCAVLGNHEFDFGLDKLRSFTERCNFPWLLSNVLDKDTGCPLGDAVDTYILQWNELKIGLLGLAEEEWLVTLPTIELDDIDFTDFVVAGQSKAQYLKQQGVDIVVALTHMTLKNDKRLALHVPDIDIIFGGHDHNYHVEQVGKTQIVKSGTDFQHASIVKLSVSNRKIATVEVEKITLDSTIPEEEGMKRIVDRFICSFEEMSKKRLGRSDSDLDGIFEHVRTRETNLGNLVADIMVESTGAEVAIVNSGTFRSNCIHPSGDFTNKDLLRILPLFDPLCVLEVKGHQLVHALENGVCRYPRLDGRFPQVSGITFDFNPQEIPGKRVSNAQVNGEKIDMEKNYTLCVKQYLANGRDGYAVLTSCPVLIDSQRGPILSTSVQHFFEGNPTRRKGTTTTCILNPSSSWDTNKSVQPNSNASPSYPATTFRKMPKVEGRIRVIGN